MTATYTNQPGTRDIDTVRYEIDDRDCIPETDAKLSDEEIQYLLDTHPHPLYAAAAACDQIATQNATAPTLKSVGDLQVQHAQGIAGEYAKRAKALRARAARKAGSAVYAGGISHADKTTMEADTDRVQPSFTIGGMDHDGTLAGDTDRGVMDY